MIDPGEKFSKGSVSLSDCGLPYATWRGPKPYA
jgi:hypothetical protein